MRAKIRNDIRGLAWIGLVAMTLAAAACGKPSVNSPVEKPVMSPEKLFETVRPSVVLVRSAGEGAGPAAAPDTEECRNRPNGGGSGFVIDDKGHILTNAHVANPCPMSWPNPTVTVELDGGAKIPARIVGIDTLADIAVLEVKDMQGLGPALPFADSNMVKTGEEVVAIGYPSYLQLGNDPTLSRGVVSTPNRSFLNIGSGVQTDAAVNHGNSGGPLLDMRGQVVGVNTMIFGREVKVENINLAISARVAQRVAQDIIQYGHARRAYIGNLAKVAINEDQSVVMAEKEKRLVSVGLMVLGVEDDAPAAGKLRMCDLVQKVDGQPIRTDGDLYNALLFGASGRPMNIEYLRYPLQKCQDVPPCAGKNSIEAARGTNCPMATAGVSASTAPGGPDQPAGPATAPSAPPAGYAFEASVGRLLQQVIDEQAQKIMDAYSQKGEPASAQIVPR